MRIATLVLAIICLLAAGGLGLVRMGTNFDHAKSMQQVLDLGSKLKALGGAKMAKSKELDSYKGKVGRTKFGGVLMLITGIIGLALLILSFTKKSMLIYIGGFALIGVCILMVLINPDYEVGATSAASARTASYIVGVPALLGALLAMGSEKLRLRKAAA